MTTRASLLLALLLALLVAAAPRAAAQEAQELVLSPADEEARAEFEAGRSAYQGGRFAVALTHFERAYELSERPELLFNIANAHDRLGHHQLALESYRGFLEQMPESTNAEFSRGRVAELERILEREAEVARGEAVGPAPTPPPQAANGPDLAGPIALLAVAGVAGLGAVGTGVGSFVVRGDLEATCTNGVCPGSSRGMADTMQALAITTDVLIGVAVAAGAAGLIWLLVALGEGDGDRASLEDAGAIRF
ncbi:MAG: tol-pal system YbgF family protein [Sandaracinaceae bacterium]